MTVKLLEIRDRGTLVPVMAIQVSAHDGPIMRRAGFGAEPMVYLLNLATSKASYDPWGWDNRTLHHAHLHIAEHWDELVSGDVVDVQFLIGETPAPKVAECV